MTLQAHHPFRFLDLPAELQDQILVEFYRGDRVLSIQKGDNGLWSYKISPSLSVAPLLVSHQLRDVAQRPLRTLATCNTLVHGRISCNDQARWPTDQRLDRTIYRVTTPRMFGLSLAHLKGKFPNLKQVVYKQGLSWWWLLDQDADRTAAAARLRAGQASLNFSSIDILKGRFDRELCRLACEGFTSLIRCSSPGVDGTAEVCALDDLTIILRLTYPLPVDGEHMEAAYAEVFNRRPAYLHMDLTFARGMAEITFKGVWSAQSAHRTVDEALETIRLAIQKRVSVA